MGRVETHVLYLGQLEVLRVDVALDLTRAVWSDRVGSQRSVGQREEGRWRNGRHHPHGCFSEISAVRGAGRWRTTHKSASILSVARCGASSTE